MNTSIVAIRQFRSDHERSLIVQGETRFRDLQNRSDYTREKVTGTEDVEFAWDESRRFAEIANESQD